MRTRSASSVVMSLVGVVGLSALTVVAAPGVSQAAKVKPPPPYYLSLGDSYSVGYQPGLGATAGYTAVVAQKEKMQLENFGCGGATSDSLLTAIGVNAGDNSAITACVLANAATVEANVLTLGTALRSALNASDDPAAAIVGLTYPDVILGDYVFPAGSPNPTLAQLSVTAFKDIVNPDLDAAYTNSAVDGTFVDVTKATDGYKALKHLVTLAPYGLIPEPVAKVCELTYYCTLGNIHANTTGYDFIGKLAAKAAKKDHAA